MNHKRQLSTLSVFLVALFLIATSSYGEVFAPSAEMLNKLSSIAMDVSKPVSCRTAAINGIAAIGSEEAIRILQTLCNDTYYEGSAEWRVQIPPGKCIKDFRQSGMLAVTICGSDETKITVGATQMAVTNSFIVDSRDMAEKFEEEGAVVTDNAYYPIRDHAKRVLIQLPKQINANGFPRQTIESVYSLCQNISDKKANSPLSKLQMNEVAQPSQNIGAGVSAVQPSFESAFYQNPAMLSHANSGHDFAIGMWHDLGFNSYDWLYERNNYWREQYTYSNISLTFGLFGTLRSGTKATIGAGGYFRSYFYDNIGVLDSNGTSRNIQMADISANLLSAVIAYGTNLSESFYMGLGLNYFGNFWKEHYPPNIQSYYLEKSKNISPQVGFYYSGNSLLSFGLSFAPLRVVFNETKSGTFASLSYTQIAPPYFNAGAAITVRDFICTGLDASYSLPWNDKNPYSLLERQYAASISLKPYLIFSITKALKFSASLSYWSSESNTIFANDDWRRQKERGYIINAGFDIGIMRSLCLSTRGYGESNYEDRISSSYGNFMLSNYRNFGYIIQGSYSGDKE